MLEVGLLHLTRDVLLIGASGGCFYLLLVALLVATFKPRRRENRRSQEPVTILVPLCGAEPQLAERLRSLCRQDYPAEIQVVCGARSRLDPAVEVVRAVASECHPASIELRIDGRAYGGNPKISNLINMLRFARHDTLVMIDSDIAIGRRFIAEMIDQLGQPGVGAVTSFYRCVAEGNAWAQLATIATNTYFLPDAILALRLRLVEPCFGACIALPRETLRRIGGLQRFADCLWDDFAIGEAVRHAGMNVALAPTAVDHVCSTDSCGDLFERELRAARIVRAITPYGQFGRIVAYPFTLAMIAALLGGGSPALLIAAVGLVGRAVVSGLFARRFGAASPLYSWLPAAELMIFAAFVTSWGGSAVIWRAQICALVDQTRSVP